MSQLATKAWTGLVQKQNHNGLTIPEAFGRDIYLTSVPITGIFYHQGIEDLDQNAIDTPIELRRESDNIHDPFALAIYSTAGRKVGYVPRKYNRIPARLLDAGKGVHAKLMKLEQLDNGIEARIGLYMQNV